MAFAVQPDGVATEAAGQVLLADDDPMGRAGREHDLAFHRDASTVEAVAIAFQQRTPKGHRPILARVRQSRLAHTWFNIAEALVARDAQRMPVALLAGGPAQRGDPGRRTARGTRQRTMPTATNRSHAR
jgi:hypothetical protein